MTRLFARALCVVLAFWCSCAFATINMAGAYYKWDYWNHAQVGQPTLGSTNDAQSACQAMFGYEQAYFGAGRLTGTTLTAVYTVGSAATVPPTAVGANCWGTLDGTYKQVDSGPRPVTVNAACPANSTQIGSTSTCSCNTGYVEGTGSKAGTCVVQTSVSNCTAGQVVSSGYYDIGTSPTNSPAATACQNGCLAIFGGSSPVGSSLVGGVKHYYAQGNYSLWGSQCDSGNGTGITGGAGSLPASSASVPSDTCASGQVSGQVNGKTVCVSAPDSSTPQTTPGSAQQGSGTASDQSTSTTTTNGDGSKTTTTTTVHTGSDGTKTTTTTTTTTNSDGTPRSTTSTTTGSDPKADACQSNPSASGCGGTPATTSAGALYTAKTATVQSILQGAQTTLSQSPIGSAMGGFFNVSGGGSCPASVWSIPYLNKTVTMDAFCTPSAMNMYAVIQAVLLVVASFMAFRIAIE